MIAICFASGRVVCYSYFYSRFLFKGRANTLAPVLFQGCLARRVRFNFSEITVEVFLREADAAGCAAQI